MDQCMTEQINFILKTLIQKLDKVCMRVSYKISMYAHTMVYSYCNVLWLDANTRVLSDYSFSIALYIFI